MQDVCNIALTTSDTVERILNDDIMIQFLPYGYGKLRVKGSVITILLKSMQTILVCKYPNSNDPLTQTASRIKLS